jgi:cell division protein FtsW (lipid II flippase)
MIGLLALEGAAWVAGPVAAAWLARAAIAGSVASARGAGPAGRSTDEVLAAADTAIASYLAGVAALAVARAWSAWRGRGNIAAPLLLPALATAVGLGVAVQMGYGDPVHYGGFPGRDAGRDALLALGAAAALLGQPWVDPVDAVRRTQRLLLGGIGATFLLLLLVGGGPAGSDQILAIGGVQPLELVKLGIVMWLADFFGRRAPKLRWQREGSRYLRWPRPRVLFPAVAAFGGTLLGLLLVRDMGPMTVIGGIFLWLMYAVTRSQGWFLVAAGMVAAVVAGALRWPAALGETFRERVGLFRDPWYNGLPVHQEVAEAAWSMASGGLAGQGPGESLALLRWGHNDLVIAQLTEDLGFVGLAAWIGLMWVIVASCAFVGTQARTAERQLVAIGVAAMLTVQSAVIFAGVTGLAPLTGIVAPFLAKGGSAMIVFAVAVAVVARVAESGRRQHDEDVLLSLGWSSVEGLVLATALALGGVWTGWRRAVADGPATTERGALIRLGDGTFRHVHDPRVARIARALPRGEILDRGGAVLAGTTEAGRSWPLGDALGTLLGPADDVARRREPWMLELRLEDRLRGYPELAEPLVVWTQAGEVVLAGIGASEAEARARAPEGALARTTLPNPDLRAFAALIHLPDDDRAAAVAALVADKAGRSVRLSLDDDLQRAVAKVVRVAAAKGEAAAAVVIDVDSGAVLARAQWPDFDPGRADLREPPERFLGMYGAWPDKTGLRGVLQAGSVFKLYTALAAAKAGRIADGGPDHACAQKDAEGPLFTRKGWPRPVHDAHGDPMHGTLDVVRGLEVSCNVYFGQLGLDLGADAMAALAAAGVDVAWGGAFKPGEDGSRQLASTAFGQGAAALHPLAAARLTAAVASGGVYRRCAPTMEADAPCEETRLFPNPHDVEPILDGLRRVMTAGTGRRLAQPAGVRVYGKTGTADADVLAAERPYGVRSPEPHSWFVAIGEPDVGAPLQAQRAGRVAVAVVVPRGGAGASAAGPAAMEILAAVRDQGYLEPQR